MTLTEEEAKTRRCQESYPACREVSPGGHVFGIVASMGGAYAMQTAPAYCIGKSCMAWRTARSAESFDPINNREPLPELGYCGKAGRP